MYLKVWTTDKGAIGYTTDGRAKSVYYKPNMLVGYLDTSLNNSIANWFNVTTNGGLISFFGTKGLYIEKTETTNPPSWATKLTKSTNYESKYDWGGTGKADPKKNVFTSEKGIGFLPKSNTTSVSLGIDSDGNKSTSSDKNGISFGDTSPDGKGDYTKWYLIGGAIVLWLVIK